MENPTIVALKRFREPAAWIGLAVIAINIAVSVLRMVQRAGESSLLNAMRSEGGSVMGIVALVFVLILVGACVLWPEPSKHAHIIAVVAAVIVIIGTVLTLANLVAGIMISRGFGAFLEIIGGGTDLALKVVIAVLFMYFSRRLQRGMTPLGTAAPDQQETVSTVPRSAAGARWGSAADALAGQQAQWGDQIPGAGWNRSGSTAQAELTQAPAAPAKQTEVVQPAAAEGPAATASRGLWEAQ